MLIGVFVSLRILFFSATSCDNVFSNQLLNVLLIASANEAANILAEHIAGSVDSFATMMNTKAEELGCENTHFTNANGLQDENHYTTAYDLALMGRYAMQNETFRKIVTTTKYTLPATNKYPEADRYFKNTNELINATKEYYCTDNYTLNGTKCQYKFTNPALQRYYCESGTLNGTKCTGSSNVPFSAYTSAVREQCQGLAGSGNYDSCLCSKSGGSYDSTNKICYKNQTVSTNAQLEYYCTSDLTLEGSNCVKYYSLDAMYKYTCPNGYTLEIDKCRK